VAGGEGRREAAKDEFNELSVAGRAASSSVAELEAEPLRAALTRFYLDRNPEKISKVRWLGFLASRAGCALS
jgi:hypothetical protein